MENFKNSFKPFGAIKKTVETDPMTPKYIKPDGTKVIEQVSEYGTVVYEISDQKRTLISRTYTRSGMLIIDYARNDLCEIGHRYDEFGQIVYEFDASYKSGNVLSKKREIEYEYYDNGQKSREFIVTTPGEIKTEIKYDENGKRTEKIEHRGTTKTWFDENDKPFKREIDRGSGGIITQDL